MSNIVKEFESRIMLTETEYLNIVSCYLKMFPNASFLQNTNIYFDSDNLFLRSNHITLRARIINGASSELTLKIKGQNGDDEINDLLTKKELDNLIRYNAFPEGSVKQYLLSLSYPLSSYHSITTLNNRRLEIKQDNHLLVIDKNSYSDIIDYNLEIEVNDNIKTAYKLLEMYIDKFNLSLSKEKYQGKATRAFKAALKIN